MVYGGSTPPPPPNFTRMEIKEYNDNGRMGFIVMNHENLTDGELYDTREQAMEAYKKLVHKALPHYEFRAYDFIEKISQLPHAIYFDVDKTCADHFPWSIALCADGALLDEILYVSEEDAYHDAEALEYLFEIIE